MIIKSLALWIQANSSLVIGTDLQVGVRHDTLADGTTKTPVDCDTLLERLPNMADRTIEGRFIYPFQIVSRAAGYMAAAERAYALHSLLHGASGFTWVDSDDDDAYEAAIIYAVRSPYSIGVDDLRNYEFSAEYQATVTEL